ncbi:MAG: hypothetical protein QM613_00655 [Micrococcaceae bacterium]
MRDKTKLLTGLGALAVITGLVLLTFFAPPAKITSTAELNQGAPVANITPDVYNFRANGADIEVDGPGKVFVAQAPQSDIKQWIGKAANTSVDTVDRKGNISTTFKNGDKTVPNPDGNDTWITQHVGQGSVKMHWENPDKTNWGLIIASDGTNPAPKTVSITWTNNHKNPFAIPLLVLGTLLLAVAAFIKYRNSDPVAKNMREVKKASKKEAKQLKKNSKKPRVKKGNKKPRKSAKAGLVSIKSKANNLNTIEETGPTDLIDQVEPRVDTAKTAQVPMQEEIKHNIDSQVNEPEEFDIDAELAKYDEEIDKPLPSRRELRKRQAGRK